MAQKYGRNQVAQIVTYGTMAAKMSIKDVARALDLPLPESNALAKLVPERPGIELKRVLHAPMTPKEGEKSLEEKDGVGPDELQNVKLLRDIYNGQDIRSQVAARIVAKGWALFELHGVSMSLEDIFLELTTDDASHAEAVVAGGGGHA